MFTRPAFEHSCKSSRDYAGYLASGVALEHYLAEIELARKFKDTDRFVLPGHCRVCDAECEFTVTWTDSTWVDPGVQMPAWREQLNCPGCGLSNRLRLSYALVHEALERRGTTSRVYLTEQVTPLFRLLQTRLGPSRVTGSEYLGDKAVPGTVREDGVRHENVEDLSFDDSSLDVVMSCDVFEHIPHPALGLAEIYRVLRPGGELLLSVPFFASREQSTVRAALVEGQLQHLLPPEFHGNPVSDEGSLVFTEYGWDLLEMLTKAGFVDARATFYWDRECGHLDVVNCMFHAAKSPTAPRRTRSIWQTAWRKLRRAAQAAIG